MDHLISEILLGTRLIWPTLTVIGFVGAYFGYANGYVFWGTLSLIIGLFALITMIYRTYNWFNNQDSDTESKRLHRK